MCGQKRLAEADIRASGSTLALVLSFFGQTLTKNAISAEFLGRFQPKLDIIFLDPSPVLGDQHVGSKVT